MPASLHAELAELARRESVSLNQLITGILADVASGRRPAARGREQGPSRAVRVALAANLVALVLAAALAVTLLVLVVR